jgi:hypothetical protein
MIVPEMLLVVIPSVEGAFLLISLLNLVMWALGIVAKPTWVFAVLTFEVALQVEAAESPLVGCGFAAGPVTALALQRFASL